MKPRTPFSRKAVIWLASIAAVSLIGGLVMGILGETPARSRGADTFSRSAVGHGALAQLLREIDIPVVISRARTAQKAQAGTILVLAEPPSRYGRGKLRDMVSAAGTSRVVVVLPKWVAMAESDGPFVDAVGSDAHRAENVLEQINVDGELGNGPLIPNVGALAGLGTASAEHEFQWVRSAAITPLLAEGDQILVGTVDRLGVQMLIIADPDLLNNAGLHRDQNAEIIVAALGELAGGESRAVIIDETLHGFEVDESAFAQLFEFPLNLALIQAAVVFMLLLWAGMRRFGPLQAAGGDLGRGQAVLIENTAALLFHGGHNQHALRQYWRDTLAEVSRVLHAPSRLDPHERLAWLGRVGAARGVTTDPQALRETVKGAVVGRHDAKNILNVARQIHAWRVDILSGSS